MATLSRRFRSILVPASLSLFALACGGTTPAKDPSGAPQPEAAPSDHVGVGKADPSKEQQGTSSDEGIPAPSDVMAAPPGSQCTPSGVCMRTLVAPNPQGLVPGPADQVDVHYTGWRQNGYMFDSSIPRGESITFPVGAVIEGWTEALQHMQEGGTYRIWIPAALAYGDQPEHPEAPAGPLTFDVELLHVIAAPAVPKDVAAAPANATCTRSGLCYVLLKSGITAGHRPGPEDRATVHYTGWTKGGDQFDSSVGRPRPSSFQVNKVIEGWTEMLQLMEEGSKVIVWIPAKLAYGDSPERPGAPAGQLTFEIELLSFIPQK
jgi:FKBP-type peptidyl-prolyl cis-trans isomerase